MELFLIVVLILVGALGLLASVYYVVTEVTLRRKTKRLEKGMESYIRSQVKSYLRFIEEDERIVNHLVAQLVVHAKTLKKKKTYRQEIDMAILDFCIELLENELLQHVIKSNAPTLKSIRR